MAKSRSIGGIYASLSLNDKGFQSGLKSAKKSLDGFASGVASFAKGAAFALPAAAAAGLAASIKSAIDAGGALNDMMARTGAAGEGLFVMQRAFENAGISGDKVPSVLNKMQKALAGVNEDGEQTNKAFQKLGVSASSLTAKDPVAAFRDLAKSISSIQNPAERTAIAMELFGKSGGELLAVFTDSGAFSQAEEQVGSLGKTLADNAAKLDAVGDALGGIGTKFQVIGAEVSVSLLPQLESMAQKINEMDFQSIGIGISEVISKTIEWASAMADVAKYTPLGFLIGQGAEAAFGGGPDTAKVNAMVSGMTKYDPAGNPGPETYWRNSMPPADDTESIRWFKNGGFAEAMRSVNGFPEPSYGVPRMLAAPDDNSTSIIPEFLKRIESAALTSRPDVNSYQARGLSLDGGNSAARAVETTNTLLGKIKDILADAKKTGGLKF